MNDAPILGGVHTVPDLDTADDFGRKHVPFVECVREGELCAIRVEVGHYVPHPNQADHWIDYIEVLAAGAPVATFEFAAGVVMPKVTCSAKLDPGTRVEVLARCNLHGLWAATATA